MVTPKQIQSIKIWICGQKINDLEKKILCYLISQSKQFTRPVRFTIQSKGPYDNTILNEATHAIGDGTVPHLETVLLIAGTDFYFSACHGGWNKFGTKISSNIELPGKDTDMFFCTFYLSHVAQYPKGKLFTAQLKDLATMTIDPEKIELEFPE